MDFYPCRPVDHLDPLLVEGDHELGLNGGERAYVNTLNSYEPVSDRLTRRGRA